MPENEQRIPGIYAYVGKTTKDEWTIKIGKAVDQTIYDRNYYQTQHDSIINNTIRIWPNETSDEKAHNRLKEYLQNTGDLSFRWSGSKAESSGTSEETFFFYSWEGLQKILALCDEVYQHAKPVAGKKIPIFQDIRHLVDDIVSGNKSYVLDLCPRWGKTNTVLLLSTKLDAQFFILSSYVGTVEASYKKTIEENNYDVDFSTLTYISADDEKAAEKVEQAVEAGQKVFYYIQTTGNGGTFERRLAPIEKHLTKKNAVLYVEEADFGSHTDNQLRKLHQIPHKHTYILSGTGRDRLQTIAKALNVKDWISKDYIADIVCSSYEDRRKQSTSIKWIDFSNGGLFRQINGPAPESAEDWAEMVNHCEDTYRLYFVQLLTALFRPERIMGMCDSAMEMMLGLIDRHYATEIFVAGDKKHYETLAGYIRDVDKNIAVKVLSGDYTSNREAENDVKQFIKDNAGKQIVLICAGMANRSFSVPAIKNVVLMLNCPSQDSVNQKIARGWTPNGGSECTVIDMRLTEGASNLSKLLAASAVVLKKRGYTFGKIVDFLKCGDKIKFYQYFRDDISVFNDKNDAYIRSALQSDELTALIANDIDPESIQYDLTCEAAVKIDDAQYRDIVKGSHTKEIRETVKSDETVTIDEPEQSEEQLSSKRNHALFLLNGKKYFYDDSAYSKDIVKSTLQRYINNDALYHQWIDYAGIDLKFLMLVLEKYEKEFSASFDDIISNSDKTKIKMKDDQLSIKMNADVEALYDKVFKPLTFKPDETVLVMFWGSYYFVNRLRKEWPATKFVQVEEVLLDADILTGKIDSHSYVNILTNLKRQVNCMKIIANPPYDKNLHLKVIDKVLQVFQDADVITLQPTRWLEDPLKKYKKSSDFSKFLNMRRRLSSVDLLDQAKTGALFNVGLPFNLGIYFFTKTGNFDFNRFENKLLDKLINQIKEPLSKHIVVDDLDGISLLISMMTGGRDGGLQTVYKNGLFSMSKERAYYFNKHNEFTGQTYYEFRLETAWGNLKPKSENTNIKFNSKEERDNFYDSYKTKFLRWWFGSTVVDVNVHSDFLPWLGDYTHPWTDEMLYKYFNLTPEEINIIEEEMK